MILKGKLKFVVNFLLIWMCGLMKKNVGVRKCIYI